MNPISSSNLEDVLSHLRGAAWMQRVLAEVHVDPSVRSAPSALVSRAELAQALNLVLFDDLLSRVPVARAYVDDVVADGRQVHFDHGAVRTVKWACGALPAGEAALTRLLAPLGYRMDKVYPLDKLGMTGRAWRHSDLPETMPQFFVSELHPERFSPAFQAAVARVLASSCDPLEPRHVAWLEQLSRERTLPRSAALELLPALVQCFSRQHAACSLEDYETLLRESAEMAWIATEGNAFNHATDRVADVVAVADTQRLLGRPIKDAVEVSQSGRVRQTAFLAARVQRQFVCGGGMIAREVPGSFYEFISRATLMDESGRAALDLQFDAGNATGIFAMTAVR